MSKRSAYFDFLRGIAILMVIAIHTYPKLTFDGASNIFQILVRQLVGCPVPIFLAISGYFLSKKHLETRELRFDFWKKQIPKVYVPALIWSIPLFALSLLHGSNPLFSVVKLFCMWFSIYYFIALIIQCYLLLPVLQRIDLNKWGGGFCCTSITCGVLIAWLEANNLPLLLYAGPCPTWIMFFCLGMYLGQRNCDYKIKPLVVGLIFSIILMMVESYALIEFGNNGFGLKPSVYVYSTFVIMILFSNRIRCSYKENKLINRFVSYVGRISFGIYLVHCYIISVMANLIGDCQWMLKWTVVSVLSIAVITLVRRICPKVILKYIGIQ